MTTHNRYLLPLSSYNTSSVSIPLVLSSESIHHSYIKVLCCGYGAGLSWGVSIIDLSDTIICLPVEI